VVKFIFRVVLGLIFLGIMALAYGIYSYKAKLENYVQDFISYGAKRSNVNLSFEDFNLNLVGAKAKAVNLFLPKAFLSLKIDEPSLNLPILSAISLSPAANFTGKLYESSVNANTSYSINKKEATGWFKIENLELNKVPQLVFLGINKGTIDFNLDSVRITEAGPQYAKGQYSLKSLSSLQEFTPPHHPNNTSRPITIPRIDDLNATGSLLFENNSLSLNEGILQSDLGNSKYEANIKFDQNRNAGVEAITAVLQVKLTQKGLQYFGFLLPEISNNILSADQSSFTVNIQGTSHNLKYSFRPQ
jgi:hypothetical protein